MQIFITRMTGKTVTIDASDGDTILLIKEKFQDKEGLSPAQVCLLFGGHELDDDKTLADYSIDKETTLTMIERVLAPAASPLQTVTGAASASEILAALTNIASSVAAAPPTITLVKMELITAVQAWRKERTGAYTQLLYAVCWSLPMSRTHKHTNLPQGFGGGVSPDDRLSVA